MFFVCLFSRYWRVWQALQPDVMRFEVLQAKVDLRKALYQQLANRDGRHAIPYGERNAIGSVIDFAQRQIEGNAHQGERKVIDVSADSAYSWNGVPLPLARERALAAGIAINGLAVLCRECSGRPVGGDLEDEFTRRIIGGPASFVVTADSRLSFAEAVRRKLLLEIAGRVPDRRLAADAP